MSLFNFLSRAIGSHRRREETRIAELFDTPCREVCDTEVPHFLSSSRIKDMLFRILYQERDKFWVVDEHNSYKTARGWILLS